MKTETDLTEEVSRAVTDATSSRGTERQSPHAPWCWVRDAGHTDYAEAE